MQKKLAILLAFFIVFAPIYSNAVLPALAATVASNGGRVLIGQTIKKVAPSAIANARKALVGICQKNPNYCRGAGAALGLKLISDGWNIDVTNNDVTNDIDVDIYKLPVSDTCEINVKFGRPNNEPPLPLTSANADYERVMKSRRNGNPKYPYEGTAEGIGEYTKITNRIKAEVERTLTTEYKFFSHFSPPFIENDTDYTIPRPQRVLGSTSAYYACLPPPTNKTYITNNELNQYITNNQINNDIDLIDIYNFDFSQYNNINIGGDTYNGTTINNDLAKSDPTEADKKVSADLKKKLDSKELSLDDVTDENCTKNEAGEYDKCGADKEPDPDNPDPDNPEEPEPEKNPTCELEENLFRKKICEWIDWTQTKHDKPESGNVDIIDKSDDLEISEDRIVFDDQCPPPTPIELVVMGFPYSEELDYQPFCDFFGMLNPFVVGMGGISSALIIAGGIRRG